jgi:hypothetical protein
LGSAATKQLDRIPVVRIDEEVRIDLILLRQLNPKQRGILNQLLAVIPAAARPVLGGLD